MQRKQTKAGMPKAAYQPYPFVRPLDPEIHMPVAVLRAERLGGFFGFGMKRSILRAERLGKPAAPEF